MAWHKATMTLRIVNGTREADGWLNPDLGLFVSKWGHKRRPLYFVHHAASGYEVRGDARYRTRKEAQHAASMISREVDFTSDDVDALVQQVAAKRQNLRKWLYACMRPSDLI